ncbi:MAG: hypothetical protein WA375_22795, partial [Pseudolabrys sp.]
RVSLHRVELGRQIWIYWPTGIAEERPPRFLTSFGMDNPNAVGSLLRPIVSDVKSEIVFLSLQPFPGHKSHRRQ